MKLVIFGATGRTGMPLVEQALAAGHEVIAFARSPEKLTIQHPNLTAYQGDAMNGQQVAKAIEGSDAVLSVLGQTKGSPANLQAVATKHIIAAMKQHGVKRLVSLTGAGVPAPQDEPKLINHLIKFALKTFSGGVLRDAENHMALLNQEKGIDWVVVRGPMLTEGTHTGDYRVGWVGVNTGPRISRADVADFMLQQLSDPQFVHQAPMISN